jgi:4-oxalomesaconate hydratase
MPEPEVAGSGPVLVVSAHAGDFVWRAAGAMALASARGDRVTVLCLSYGERGESGRQEAGRH